MGTGKDESKKKGKKIVSQMRLTTKTAVTEKKSVKVSVKNTKKTAADIKKLKALGLKVRYRFYRSSSKRSGYKGTAVRKTNSYTWSKAKKGKRYYYRTQICVYDKKGKLVAKTKLKKSSCVSRVRRK